MSGVFFSVRCTGTVAATKGKRRRGWAACGLTAALAVGACASALEPDPAVERARAQVQAAASDPLVNRFAHDELYSAEDAFAQAELGWRRGMDAREIARWARVAEERAAMARETAARRDAEEQARAAEAERQRQAAEQASGAFPAASSSADALAGSAPGVVITLSDNQFLAGRADLDPRADATIEQIAHLLQEDSRRSARIDGHSDEQENRSRSIELSGRRADAVRAALIGRGIDARRLSVRALGDSYPAASNETALGRQRNRRVEVIVSEPGAPSSQGGAPR